MLAKHAATILVATLLVASAAAPVAAGKADATTTATIEVTEEATVLTVEQDGSAAADVEVTVSAAGEALFEGEKTDGTDANAMGL